MARAPSIQPHERRAEIIAATERLIVAQGGNVSTRAIAEAAGIAEGTIFRVFPTKDAILDAIVEDAFNSELHLAEIGVIDPGGDLAKRMIAVVAILQRRTRRLMALFSAIGFRKPPSMAKTKTKKDFGHERSAQAIATILEPDRDLLRLAPLEAARILQAMVMAQSNPMVSDRPDTPETIVDLILNGIARHPAPPPSLSPASKGPSC